MMQRIRSYALERRTERVNDLYEAVRVWEPVGTIRAAVSAAAGSTAELNQIRRIESTHTALTHDDVRVGDRFGGYVVDYVVEGARWRQLFLSREDAIFEDQD